LTLLRRLLLLLAGRAPLPLPLLLVPLSRNHLTPSLHHRHNTNRGQTVSTTKTKLADLDTQYQLVDKAKSAVVLAVDLSGAAVEKAVELNEKYSLVDKATEAAKDAAKKVKESIDKA